MSKVIYIDMDNVLCNFSKAYHKALLENPEIKFPQSQYGFFRDLEPIIDSIEAVEFLDAQDDFSVYFLTAPSIKNPLCYTEKRLWIEDKFGLEMVQQLIISPNKGLNKGDYLIDDHQSGKGQESFEGELIHFGSDKYKTWKQVLNYFKEKYNLQ